jgi:hypothetical protein
MKKLKQACIGFIDRFRLDSLKLGNEPIVDDKKLDNIYKEVFLESPKGYEILKDLSEKADMIDMGYSNNTNLLLFKEGKRALFSYICYRLKNDNLTNIQGEIYND